MFPTRPLPYPRLTKEQQDAWSVFASRLRSFAEGQDAASNPRVFHGTTRLRAGWISRDGFWGRGSGEAIGLRGQVFWTTNADTAIGFAEERVGWRGVLKTDDLPAILTARLSDVLASGAPRPDNNYASHESDECATWQESLSRNGLLRIMSPSDGAPCAPRGMSVLGPAWRRMKLHPQAAEDRRARLADPGQVQPPPGLEWTADGPAATWGDIEVLEFGKREASGRVAFDEDAWHAWLLGGVEAAAAPGPPGV